MMNNLEKLINQFKASIPPDERTNKFGPMISSLLEMNAALMDRLDLVEKILAYHKLREDKIFKFKVLEVVDRHHLQQVYVVEVLEDCYANEILYKDNYIDDRIMRVTGIESFANSRYSDKILGSLYCKGEKIALKGRSK